MKIYFHNTRGLYLKHITFELHRYHCQHRIFSRLSSIHEQTYRNVIYVPIIESLVSLIPFSFSETNIRTKNFFYCMTLLHPYLGN